LDVSLSITGIAALLAAGLIGGFINTLAGGGEIEVLDADEATPAAPKTDLLG